MAGIQMVTTPKAAANSRSFDAFVSMLFIGHCAAWSFLAVVMIRMPYSGMIWLMGPVLCTLGSLGGHCRTDRMCALFRNLALMGVLQFGFVPHLELR